MNANFPKVEEFIRQLEKQAGDFVCTTRLPGSCASVQFAGSFLGQTVLWHMTLATLAHYRETTIRDVADAGAEYYPCPFIEIDEGFGRVYRIRVGLNLEVIDEPAVRKSIIMIRNYKRLALGKIEFCGSDT